VPLRRSPTLESLDIESIEGIGLVDSESGLYFPKLKCLTIGRLYNSNRIHAPFLNSRLPNSSATCPQLRFLVLRNYFSNQTELLGFIGNILQVSAAAVGPRAGVGDVAQ
jgi:hypothetical protein